MLLLFSNMPVIPSQTASLTALGGNGGKLWEVYQEEIGRILAPKPRPKSEWQPPPKKDWSNLRTNIQQPDMSGFFAGHTDPLEAAASAEARANQVKLNSKTISDLLKKTRR